MRRVKGYFKSRARAFEASAVSGDKHEPDVGSIKDNHVVFVKFDLVLE